MKNQRMKNFSKELSYLEILLDEEFDLNMTLIVFIKNFHQDKDFQTQCRPFEDFILKKHILEMASQSDGGRPVKLSKIEFFKADEYGFIYGSGQSADMKVVVVFFMFDKTGKGLMNCINRNSGNGILGPFTMTKTNPNAGNLGEISLN